jgi:hypothetical protein
MRYSQNAQTAPLTANFLEYTFAGDTVLMRANGELARMGVEFSSTQAGDRNYWIPH